MAERVEFSPTTIEKTSPVSQAVVVMFPDVRTADGVTRKFTTTFPDTLPGEFLSKTQSILKRYKQQGYAIFGSVYDDTEPEHFSGLYDYYSFDSILPIGHTYDQWTHERYQSVISKIIDDLHLLPQATVVVGGYHAEDCVAEMAAALRRLGHASSVDLRLTDELPFLLIGHRGRKILGSSAPLSSREGDLIIWEDKKKQIDMLVQNAV